MKGWNLLRKRGSCLQSAHLEQISVVWMGLSTALLSGPESLLLTQIVG